MIINEDENALMIQPSDREPSAEGHGVKGRDIIIIAGAGGDSGAPTAEVEEPKGGKGGNVILRVGTGGMGPEEAADDGKVIIQWSNGSSIVEIGPGGLNISIPTTINPGYSLSCQTLICPEIVADGGGSPKSLTIGNAGTTSVIFVSPVTGV